MQNNHKRLQKNYRETQTTTKRLKNDYNNCYKMQNKHERSKITAETQMNTKRPKTTTMRRKKTTR